MSIGRTSFRKVGDLTKRPFDWNADVAKVQARTLLVFADADSIRPERFLATEQKASRRARTKMALRESSDSSR
jgi:hypothetical protein